MKNITAISFILILYLPGSGCSFVSQLEDTSPESSELKDVNTANKDAHSDLTTLEDEEKIFEDPDEIANLISVIIAGEQKATTGAKEAQAGASSTTLKTIENTHSFSGYVVPPSFEIWQMTDDQCMAAIQEAGISVERPDFETPFVKTPLLLKGPIEGVAIAPKWPRDKPVNSVMDCRLIVALVNVARQAALHDIEEVLFYSTYRPLNIPKGPCERGRKGRQCRAREKAYKKAKKGKMSQHRRATAIDIRWFKKRNGHMIDVLEHYELNDKAPPCNDNPKTEDGIFLKEFACALHRSKTFNVILTPNANKDHHNHFHMDITPGASWYIIR